MTCDYLLGPGLAEVIATICRSSGREALLPEGRAVRRRQGRAERKIGHTIGSSCGDGTRAEA